MTPDDYKYTNFGCPDCDEDEERRERYKNDPRYHYSDWDEPQNNRKSKFPVRLLWLFVVALVIGWAILFFTNVNWSSL